MNASGALAERVLIRIAWHYPLRVNIRSSQEVEIQNTTNRVRWFSAGGSPVEDPAIIVIHEAYGATVIRTFNGGRRQSYILVPSLLSDFEDAHILMYRILIPTANSFRC
ncbi:unnamed protein product [Somion occarium]|uniref:Uncharacterized protein n=1 Tax=Somion occarium TaxID=3059160 RepID=A0ABP1E0E9_9APHY